MDNSNKNRTEIFKNKKQTPRTKQLSKGRRPGEESQRSPGEPVALVGVRRTVRGSEKQGSEEAWVQSDRGLRPT